MSRQNPAIKRILADVKELKAHPSSRYFARPLEDNMFEWHFTIRGPADTPFAEGIYHGRILLPSEYPMKPPNIVFLTKNGRFEVGTKICLSISAYHEESWQPAWGVRTMLEAIISFMPTEGMGAIGALDWTAEERKKLALESRNFCCSVCGKVADLLTDPKDDVKAPADEQESQQMAQQIAQMHMKAAPAPSSPHVPGSGAGLTSDFLGANLGSNVESAFGEGELGADTGGLAGGEARDGDIGDSTAGGGDGVDGDAGASWQPGVNGGSPTSDFMADTALRMDDLQLAVDARDNYDGLGMLEQDRGDQVVGSRGSPARPPHSVGASAGGVGSAAAGTPVSGEKSGVSDAGTNGAGYGFGLRQRHATGTASSHGSPARSSTTTSSRTETVHVASPAQLKTAAEGAELQHSHSPSQVEQNVDEARAETLRQAALRDIAEARGQLHNVLAQVQDHMQAIDQQLPQQANAGAQGERAAPAVGAAGDAAVGMEGQVQLPGRDVVDEILGYVLMAIGTTIALMVWRLISRCLYLFGSL